MRAVFLFALIVCVVSATSLDSLDSIHLTQELVDTVNKAQTSWKASLDQGEFFKGATTRQVMGLMGVRKEGAPVLPRRTYNARSTSTSPYPSTLPESFDAAEHWPQCSTIPMIRDQSACGSCWAFGAAEAISDRYCTASNTPKNVSISATNLLACCDTCGSGCQGGFPPAAWAYWVSTGLVDSDCDPYPFPHCAHHENSTKYKRCPKKTFPTPSCQTTCKNGAFWSDSLYKGTDSWSLQGEYDFMMELYQNGPFEVSLEVYKDFLTYKSGVYHRTTGPQDKPGGHAVRLVGWGVLNGEKYWKIANSWNESWGANGYILIRRGVNECGIEDSGVAGQP